MPSKDPKIQKAYKDGVITKGQYDKLSDGLLLGIIKKKSGGASVKPRKNKTEKAKKEGVIVSGRSSALKEKRHKLGKEEHKRGRPKGGSKVKIVS
tara:strand:- start:577 stop:861 length:285 start_codon:yes stop_codon:yes gene_type:complete